MTVSSMSHCNDHSLFLCRYLHSPLYDSLTLVSTTANTVAIAMVVTVESCCSRLGGGVTCLSHGQLVLQCYILLATGLTKGYTAMYSHQGLHSHVLFCCFIHLCHC